MLKRLLCILLVACMLLVAFTACADNGDGNADNTGADSSATSEDEAWVKDDIPNVDYNKADFNIVAYNQLDLGPLAEERDEGDALDQAVWERNAYIQDRFNITINGTTLDDYINVSSEVKKCVSSGDLTYHAAYVHMVNGTSLASSNQLYNLNKLEMINKSATWWDKDVSNGFQIAGVLYMTAGDILPSTMLITACMAFNKNLFQQKGLDYPYEAAENGEWTLDMLSSLTKDQTTDKNGDGTISEKDDFYGLVSWYLDSPFNFYFGSGCTMIAKNDDDIPEYSVDAQKIQNIYEKVYEIFIDQNSYLETEVANATYPFQVFSEGRALFVSCSLSTMSGSSSFFKKMTDEYGVLPQPKYDSKGEYLGFVNGAAAMLAVPKVLTDDSPEAEFVGNVIEGMANASYNIVTPTLWNVIAKAKNVQDQQSADMVDIIIRHRVFDFAYAHYFDQSLACATLFRDCLKNKDKSVTSKITKGEKSTKKQIDRTIKNYQKNE